MVRLVLAMCLCAACLFPLVPAAYAAEGDQEEVR
jgi:hypothetical protein